MPVVPLHPAKLGSGSVRSERRPATDVEVIDEVVVELLLLVVELVVVDEPGAAAADGAMPRLVSFGEGFGAG